MKKAPAADAMPEVERHVSGQELCAAIRRYAQDQFGYMAKCVLNHWGIRSTGDFGEIVFNMIRVGQMRKTPQDRREDFDENFDFEVDLQQTYRITVPPTSETSSV
ncbi:MAG: Minf_1886 family protein, partial [Pirellulales bacterium]